MATATPTHAQQVTAMVTLIKNGSASPTAFTAMAGGGSVTTMATSIATKFAGTALFVAICKNILKWKVEQDQASLTSAQATVSALQADITANTLTG